ncbi:hypothetical protein [Flavobacterium sp. RSSB_23]|uniref:hypothetical protein n=1 Tax=Flavobacterium sp. RSSB_23 TaxID=3447668 RepID=UPI003F318F75
MKNIWKILLVIFIFIIIGLVIVTDIFDRGQYYSTIVPKEEMIEFYMYKTTEEQEKAFEKNFGNQNIVSQEKKLQKSNYLETDFC